MITTLNKFFILTFAISATLFTVQLVGCSKSEPAKKTEIPTKQETKQLEIKQVDVKEFLKDDTKSGSTTTSTTGK